MNDYQKTFNARGHLYNDAMSAQPGAREAERAALLDRARMNPGQRVMDAPAGGGYVADGVRAKLGDQVQLVCVEPCARFSAAMDARYHVLNEPLDSVSLPDASLDVILSLAGLHHLDDRMPVYREWARLLRPGGQLVVADVGAGTGTARFLNGFVNRHTPGGHHGIFISEREFSEHLAVAGFFVEEDSMQNVPWRFRDREGLGSFCHTLFNTSRARPEAVADALETTVGLQRKPGGLALAWQLRYASAWRQA
ncbi:MAG: class I SAM-dependent methyltransferase [Chromatiales bacterium]|nr:class I SAM-dependent methyltransferase [Chromatiales bacterium]